MIRRDEIRQLKEAVGPRQFVMMFNEMLEGRQLPNGYKPPKLDIMRLSIRALWEGLVGPIEETLPSAREAMIYPLQEEVDSSAFVAVTKLLLANRVIDGYNETPGIGENLVTTMPSNRRVENVPGFSDLEGLKTVPEGFPYEDSSVADKYVTTQALKKGRLLSITEETIMEDQTGQLLLRAGNIGRVARQDKERTIVEGVIDLNSNVYRPSGTATALYSVANLNLVGNASTPGGSPFNAAIALNDWTDLQEIEQYHAEQVNTDRQRGTGEPVLWNPGILFVPSGLKGTGLRIRNATTIESIVTNQRTSFNNPKAGTFEVYDSPYIGRSSITGAANDWYYGEFKRQFFWQDVWPIQVFRQDATGPEAFGRDVVVVFKVRYLGGIFCTDTRWVMKVVGS